MPSSEIMGGVPEPPLPSSLPASSNSSETQSPSPALFNFSLPFSVFVFCLALISWIPLFQGSPSTPPPSSLPPPRTPPALLFLTQPLSRVHAAALHFARDGRWVTAPSPSSDAPVLPPGTPLVTLPPAYHDFPAFTSSCGSAEERALPLSQRWRLPAGGGSLPDYPTWDYSLTCAALAGHAVVVVGDSLSGEFTDTLVSALRHPSSGGSLLRAFRANVCPGGRVPVLSVPATRFSDEDHFPHWEEPTFYAPRPLNGLLFREALGEAAAAAAAATGAEDGARSVWVLNRGAHFADTGEHLARVAAALAYVRALAPRAAVLWRTTPPAHPDAVEDPARVQRAAPLREPLNESRYAGNAWAQRYHWWAVWAQNGATLQSLPGDVVPLDVARGAALRHDSHCERGGGEPDGTHYCMPGPIDTWVELFAAVVRFARFGGAAGGA